MATNTNETSDSVASEQNPLQTPNPQLGYDFSSLLPQENIDAIYFAEYGIQNLPCSHTSCIAVVLTNIA